MSKNLTGAVAVLVASSVVWSVPALAKSIDREFHKTFEVSPGTRLELFHGDGDVEITPWDRNTIEVHVRYRAEIKGGGMRTEPDFDVEFAQSGATVRVQGREIGGKGIGIFFNHEYEYAYTIQAPAYVVLDTRGDDGDVVIGGWRGDIEVTLDDGDLTLRDIESGKVQIRGQDGDIEIDKLAGPLAIQMDDGDISIKDCDSNELEIRAQDGDVALDSCRGNFDIALDDGDVDIRRASVSKVTVRAQDGSVDLDLDAATGPLDVSVTADDGSVSVELGDGISASFSIETDDGSVRVTPAEWILMEKDHRVTGKIGSGEGSIRIVTNDGSVTLR